MVSVSARRSGVAYAQERGLSARRACTLLRVARSALGYRSRKAPADAPVIERMTQLARRYPRFGYRRIRIFLARDGHRMSPGRAHRLWRAAGLQIPRKRPRKRIASSRPRPLPPKGAEFAAGLKEQGAQSEQASDNDAVFVSRKTGAQLRERAILGLVSAPPRAGLEAPVSPHWLRHAHDLPRFFVPRLT
jgi:transposase InsO family protein